MTQTTSNAPQSAGRAAIHWLAALLWAGLIFYLSAQPASAFPVLPTGSDKLVHLVEYGVLSVLLYRALIFGGPGLRPGTALWLAILLSLLYGVSDEIHQALEPSQTRDASAGDVLADALGATLAAFAYHHHLLARRNERRSSPPKQESA